MKTLKLKTPPAIGEFFLTEKSGILEFADAMPSLMQSCNVTSNTGSRIASLLKKHQAAFIAGGIITVSDFVIKSGAALDIAKQFISEEKWTFKCFAQLLVALKPQIMGDKTRTKMFAMRNPVSQLVSSLTSNASIDTFCNMLVGMAVNGGKSQSKAEVDFAILRKSLHKLGCKDVKDLLNLRFGKVMGMCFELPASCKEPFLNIVEGVSHQFKSQRKKGVYLP